MKQFIFNLKFLPAIFIFAFAGINSLNAQTAVCMGEEVCITIPTNLRGTIQWEQSADLITWVTIVGETNDTICFIPSTTGYYRAVISEGTCDDIFSDIKNIIVNPQPVADAGADIIYCDGGSDTLGGNPTASAGTGPFIYAWSPVAGLNNNSSANPIVTASASASYIVLVTDANGCFDQDTAVVTVNPTPIADAGNDTSITCAGTATLGGAPTASGGSMPYAYNWNPASFLSSAISANPVYTPGLSAIYSITVTDANGCSATDAVVVTVTGGGGGGPGTTTFSYTGSPQMFIVPNCINSISINCSGGEGGGANSNPGGLGGNATGNLAVNSGDTLWVYVGGEGQDHNFAGGIDYEALGGWNGGGKGGYDNSGQVENGGGGGGGSDVRPSSDTTFAGRVIAAAGGGGGAGGFFSGAGGGAGGGTTGTDGGFTYTAIGGTGGTQSAGGVAGTLTRGATNGVLGIGGRGSTNQNAWGSGGAGGGYYGGGGGTSTMDHSSGHAAAGGGGSSYIGGVTAGGTTAGVRSGNGEVVISW